jgi:UDP-glucose 4-epimerase
MNTVLVTGAAGFIGSALAQKLILEGNKVITIDNLSTGYKSALPKDVEFYEGNCQDAELIASLEKYTFSTIYHIAGQSSGEISFDDPVYDLQTNAQSTLLLLKLAMKTGCKQFIYASTMSVYGDKPDVPVAENLDSRPKSFYGVGKLASEHYMRIYEQYGINSTALRLFNVYGPGQNMLNLRQGMVSIFLAQAIKDHHVHVKGSAKRYRDFIYIDDVIDALIKVREEQPPKYTVFNIATGIRTTVGELIELIRSFLEYEVSVHFEGSTPGDQMGITGNNSAIKNELNWCPQINLEEGLNRMIAWAKEETSA